MIIRGALLWFGCAVAVIYAELKLDTKYSWKYLDYEFDSPEETADAIQSGRNYFRMNLPIDVDVVRDGRIFITVRRRDGVPSTLNTISTDSGNGLGNLLKAYPNWSWANPHNCDNLIGVYKVAHDECNRLWVLDGGKYEDVSICRPKLLAFDLTTDSLVQRVDIPDHVATNAAGIGSLVSLMVETVGENCSETNVYMGDALGYGLVIWNGKNNRIWRIESPYFEPDPGGEQFHVRGVDFEMTRGLMGMALTPDTSEMEKLFYFRPLSSFRMYFTKAINLHRKRNHQEFIEYFVERTHLPSQSVTQAFSSQGILFFSSVADMNILCWNRHKPFIPENIVEITSDMKTLQWASSIKVNQEDGQETLWVLTNRLQNSYTNKLNFTRTNFRVLKGIVQDFVSGTNCEPEN